MKKIGILSDTHGYVHPELGRIFENCHEIWHCGDFGSYEVAEKLKAMAPLRGVYGNIDGQEIRQEFGQFSRFWCEEVDVLITHIGGYPSNYDSRAREIIKVNPPTLFVCGHSHILKVMFDKRFNLLHINPGAAGKSGFHKVITMIRLTIDGKKIKDLELVEFEKQTT